MKKIGIFLSLLFVIMAGVLFIENQEIYAASGKSVTGLVKQNGKYYYYKKGKLIKDKTVTVKNTNTKTVKKYVYDLSAEDGQLLRKITYKTNGQIVYKWYNAEKLANERATKIMNILCKQYKKTHQMDPTPSQKLLLAWNYSTKYVKTIKKKSNGLLNGFHYQYNEPSRKRKTWRAEYAVYMFEQGSGRCYSFACSFGYLARACGYPEAKIYVGQTNRIGGGRTPHAWVTIDIDGSTYYFDPQMKNKHTKANYYMMKDGIGGIGYFDGKDQ